MKHVWRGQWSRTACPALAGEPRLPAVVWAAATEGREFHGEKEMIGIQTPCFSVAPCEITLHSFSFNLKMQISLRYYYLEYF